MNKGGHVYILASMKRGIMYVGVTADLTARVLQHRAGEGGRFSRRYRTHRLVHIETFDDITDAIAREKALKKWRRQWKFELIEADNPDWNDLFPAVAGQSR